MKFYLYSPESGCLPIEGNEEMAKAVLGAREMCFAIMTLEGKNHVVLAVKKGLTEPNKDRVLAALSQKITGKHFTLNPDEMIEGAGDLFVTSPIWNSLTVERQIGRYKPRDPNKAQKLLAELENQVVKLRTKLALT